MAKENVAKSGGTYRVAGTRVSLDSLVYLFREVMSAESMVESYPSLTLEDVHGALAFYLANRAEVDTYLSAGESESEAEHSLSRQTNAELLAKLRRARNETHVPG